MPDPQEKEIPDEAPIEQNTSINERPITATQKQSPKDDRKKVDWDRLGNIFTVIAALTGLIFSIITAYQVKTQTILSNKPAFSLQTEGISAVYHTSADGKFVFDEVKWVVVLKNIGVGPAINTTVEFSKDELNKFINYYKSIGKIEINEESAYLENKEFDKFQQIVFDKIHLGTEEDIELDFSSLAYAFVNQYLISKEVPSSLKLALGYNDILNNRLIAEAYIRVNDITGFKITPPDENGKETIYCDITIGIDYTKR